jgi:type IV pilus assembly protein PilO
MSLKDFKFENLPFTSQLAVMLVLAGALAGIFYVYYLQGTLAEKGGLEGEVAKLESSVAQGNAVAAQLARFKRELALLEARLDELRSILPAQKETPQILQSVLEMAALSELKIIRFVPKAVVPRGFYNDWPIQLEVEGSYNGLGAFFEKVGMATRLVNIDNVTVRGIEGSTDHARTLQAACTATTFVFSEDKVRPETKKN